MTGAGASEEAAEKAKQMDGPKKSFVSGVCLCVLFMCVVHVCRSLHIPPGSNNSSNTSHFIYLLEFFTICVGWGFKSQNALTAPQ